MDGPKASAAVGTGPQPAPVPAPVRPAAPTPVLPSLLPGAVLEATVVASDAGRARLSWQGILFEALADVPLQPGRTYDLLVTALQPQLTLSLGRTLPDTAAARAGGQLGSAAEAWFAPLAALWSDTPANAPVPLQSAGQHPPDFARALAAWASGKGTAADLATIHRLLGHDQEVRVLRLPPPDATGGRSPEAEDLQHTQKALALRALDEPAQPEARLRAARELVAGLGRIERDNVARREQGAPLWLPLPAVPEQGLRDARLFVWPGPPEGAERSATDETFRVVLLLDLTQLGELRVDVGVRDRRVNAVFTAVQPGTVHRLVVGLPQLRAAMAQAGLEVADLRVQPASGDRLPIADLTLRRRDDALVDVHA